MIVRAGALRRAALVAAVIACVSTGPRIVPLADAAGFGPLVLRDLDGQSTSLAALRGHVVVLNFWATWCKPCIEEMPVLAELSDRYRERGLVVVAASVDDVANQGDIARIASRLPNTVKVWVGATLEDMERLDLGMSVPVTVVLDRDGEVVERQRGTITRGAMDGMIERLLGAPQQSPKKRFDSVEARDAGDGEPRTCETKRHAPAAGTCG